MKQRLSARRFVSMEIERALGLPASSEHLEETLNIPSIASRLDREIEIGNVKYDKALDYVKQQDPRTSNINSGSTVFEAGMPGVMPLSELGEKVDLGSWKLAVKDRVYEVQVRAYRLVHAFLIDFSAGSCRLGQERRFRSSLDQRCNR